MAYNYPKSASMVVSARFAVSATNQSLSAVTFNNLDFGSAYMQGSAPYTGFICPAPGTFEFRMSSWGCGSGDTTIQVTSTRVVTIVYNQAWAQNGGCGLAHDHWFIPNCQVGDVITFKMNENNTASPVVTSITDPTIQGQGNFQAIYWPQYS